MELRDIGENLPPGFRFNPSDEELVCHYLLKKITNEEALKGTLVEIDLHTCEPWQLPEVAKLNSTEWYFFSFRDRKYATGFRTNRATGSGYWKATGKDRMVLDPMTRSVVGMRKTLVFYKNRAPNGIKTGWIMHEFRLENPNTPPKEDWVLCRVFHKSKGENNNKLSPQNTYDHQNFDASTSIHNTLPCDIISSSPTLSYLPVQTPNNFLNFSAPDHDYLRIIQDYNHGAPSNDVINMKCEDESGFLSDMNFHDSNMRDAANNSSLEDFRFDEETGSIFM